MVVQQPIVVSDVWDLRADPAALESAAEAWRALKSAAQQSDDTVRAAAGRVLAHGSWTGDAADSFGAHRDELVRALGRLAELAGGAAEGLDAAAYLLRTGQSQLDGQFSALSGVVPATRVRKEISFQPADEGQAERVRGAVREANDVRDWVDERLSAWAGTLRRIEGDLATLGEAWPSEQRSIRLLNLNIARGAGNVPWDDKGTETGELRDIVRIIEQNDANVVTVQEAFHNDIHGGASILERLRAHHDTGLVEMLEEATGDDWEAHFTPASHKFNLQGGDNPFNTPEEFGNAILVRRDGDLIEDTTEIADESLQDDGPLGSINVGEEGRSINGARIELADPD